MKVLTLSNFRNVCAALHGGWLQERFLVAVSGGADSMVLAHLLLKSGVYFEVAHVNYNLRGGDSHADRDATEAFCKKHNIAFHLYEVGNADGRPSGSIQLWARNLRYGFFRKIQKERNLPVLVTAHHLNDQLETFLINLTRGSGLRGLSGIPAFSNGILRPLLSFSKDEIYRYGEENAIPYREDLSNAKKDYLRNKIRHNVVPELLLLNDNFLENFSTSIHNLAQAKDFLKGESEQIFSQITELKGKDLAVNRRDFTALPLAAKHEIMRTLGFGDTAEIEKMQKAESGSIFKNPKGTLLVHRDEFIFKKNPESQSIRGAIPLAIDQQEIMLPVQQLLTIRRHGHCSWTFDGKKLRIPLKLRARQAGDWLMPTGMTGRKKVSKLLKDLKLSKFTKDEVWLLCDAENEILGVLPYRQDRRFTAKEETKIIVKLNI